MNHNGTGRWGHIQQGLVNVPIKHHPTEPWTSNKHSLLCDWRSRVVQLFLGILTYVGDLWNKIWETWPKSKSKGPTQLTMVTQ